MKMSEFIQNKKEEAEKAAQEKANTQRTAYQTIARVLRDSAYWDNANMVSSSLLYLMLNEEGIDLFNSALSVLGCSENTKINCGGRLVYKNTVGNKTICIEADGLKFELDDILQDVVEELCDRAQITLEELDKRIIGDHLHNDYN